MTATKGVFKKYSNPIFVETGTHYGLGIKQALNEGFQKIYSIELDVKLCARAIKMFDDNNGVHNWLGDSGVKLQELLKEINEPVTFWLDAHYGDTVSPLLKELDAIKSHHIKTHTILIDDLRDWKVDKIGFDTSVLKEKLLEINKDYKFAFENGHIPNDILAAYIKRDERPPIIKKAYVINLDERKNRLKEFNGNKIPFEVERFPAVKMSPGIMGCNESHKRLLQGITQFPTVVFEDDCLLIEDWSIVETAIKQLPVNWDILYLGANLNTPLVKHSTNLYVLKKAWTTHAIIYNTKKVIDFIIEGMPKDITPIDVFYSNIILEKFNCFIVNPIVAIQKAGFSDVGKGNCNYEKLLLRNFNRNTK